MNDPPERRNDWHLLDGAQTRVRLDAPEDGLTEREAARRLAQQGPNELTEGRRRTPLAMLVDQFRDFMIVVLIVAAVVSGLIGEAADTIAIVVIVVLNAVLGFVQEWRAQRALAALKRMAAPSATVVRAGAADRVSMAADLATLMPQLVEMGRTTT
ncbi:MAG: ATPase, partial [Deinococcus-Thermus bacterium]|nr:ATPase [Deinococcota bacterium]